MTGVRWVGMTGAVVLGMTGVVVLGMTGVTVSSIQSGARAARKRGTLGVLRGEIASGAWLFAALVVSYAHRPGQG